MLKKFYTHISSQKNEIGFIHGVLTIIGALILSYLTMMCFSKYISGDYAIKIVPSIICTPLLLSCYSIWLLFSKTIKISFLKLLLLSFVLILLLKVF